jgi:carbon starvation protein
MDALLIMLLAFAGYIVMYQLYGKFLSRRIFQLDPGRKTPAVVLNDGMDYVPTKKEIIFGHHFTSIAGTGPIVGPAIAVIWGWVPALIWIFVGSVIMGAVHDFGALVISMRNQGKSISDYTAKYVNERTTVFLLPDRFSGTVDRDRRFRPGHRDHFQHLPAIGAAGFP